MDANGQRATFVYDGQDNQASWQFPSPTRPSAFNPATPASALSTAGAANGADKEQYGYDANGNRTLLIKRDGQSIGTYYDALNRLTTKDVPGTALDVIYSYDLLGRRLSSLYNASSQGITSTWDNAGRQTSSTDTDGGTSRTLTYGYDADGNRTSIQHPDGNSWGTAYDGLDRAAALYENTAFMASIAYDGLGRRSSMGRLGASTTYAYDGASRLTGLAHDLAGSASDVSWSFTYNLASQALTRTLSNDAYAYAQPHDATRAYASNGLNQ